MATSVVLAQYALRIGCRSFQLSFKSDLRSLLCICVEQGSLCVTQAVVEYFQASWQGLSTSQVVFLLVEAVGRPSKLYAITFSSMCKFKLFIWDRPTIRELT